MKKIAIILLCLLVFVACKKENSPLTKIKEASQVVKKTTHEVKNVSSIMSNLNSAKELEAKLKLLEPLSNDAWKKWMPTDVETLKRTTYTIGHNGMVNVSSAKLEYRDSEVIKKRLKLEIIDGAGSGSGIAHMYKMVASMKLDSENERGYKKIHARDNITVKERHSKTEHTNSTQMEFLANERFAVNATGYNMEPNEMWSYLKALDIENLKE